MARNQELYEAIMKGKRDVVVAVLQKAAAAKADMAEILDYSMIPAMREMGDRFSRNEVYVPEMLIAARAMQAGLAIVEPILANTDHEPLGKVCVGTVKGDLHDIGKNLVAIMLKGAGYDVVDCGVNCDTNKFDEAVAKGATVVCCSALLTTTMPYMKVVIDAFGAQPDLAHVKLAVGGAPVNRMFADEIGADGYGADAPSSVEMFLRFINAA